MKRTFLFSAAFLFILAIYLPSCVSSKKFYASEAMNEKLQNDYLI
jgi:hypothetical protein